MTDRPRCAYCDKPAPKLCTTVWVRKSTDPHKHADGNWYRYLYVPVPLHSLHDCQTMSNQQVVSVRYGFGNTVNRFSEWDGESYWLPKEPCCTVECLQRYAKACYDSGMRMVRNDEEVAA